MENKGICRYRHEISPDNLDIFKYLLCLNIKNKPFFYTLDTINEGRVILFQPYDMKVK